MVFYSTNGDQDLAVFEIQTLLQLLLKHRANKRNMLFFSTHRDNARSVVITSSTQEEHVFYVSKRHQVPAVVITP